MARLYRQPSEATKAKISAAMKNYWRSIPNRPEPHTSMADYLGKTDADNNNKSVPSSTPK